VPMLPFICLALSPEVNCVGIGASQLEDGLLEGGFLRGEMLLRVLRWTLKANYYAYVSSNVWDEASTILRVASSCSSTLLMAGCSRAVRLNWSG